MMSLLEKMEVLGKMDKYMSTATDCYHSTKTITGKMRSSVFF